MLDICMSDETKTRRRPNLCVFSFVNKIENSVFLLRRKKELALKNRISIKTSQFRHNYNARVVGAISLLSRR